MAIPGQITLFEMMDEYNAPRLPLELARAGVKAWIIEWCAITNSHQEEAPIISIRVRARMIMFKRDSKVGLTGWQLYWDTIDGLPYMGAWGTRQDIFAKEPGFPDMERYVREKTKDKARYNAVPIEEWRRESA